MLCDTKPSWHTQSTWYFRSHFGINGCHGVLLMCSVWWHVLDRWQPLGLVVYLRVMMQWLCRCSVHKSFSNPYSNSVSHPIPVMKRLVWSGVQVLGHCSHLLTQQCILSEYSMNIPDVDEMLSPSANKGMGVILTKLAGEVAVSHLSMLRAGLLLGRWRAPHHCGCGNKGRAWWATAKFLKWRGLLRQN